MINRRHLFSAALSAIAALTVGKAQAAPQVRPLTPEEIERDIEEARILTALYHEHFGIPTGQETGRPDLYVYMSEETAATWDEIVASRTTDEAPSPYFTTMVVGSDGTLVPAWEHPELRPDNTIVGYQMAYRNGDAGAYWTVPGRRAEEWVADTIFSQDVESVFVYLAG